MGSNIPKPIRVGKNFLFSPAVSLIMWLMLKFLRLHTKRIFVTILLLIIPAFCFFGLDMVMRSSAASNVAGTLYGKKVKIDQFLITQRETRNQMLIQMVLLFGIQNFDQFSALRNRLGDYFTRANLNQLTWERILLHHLAKQNRIPVDESEVVKWVSDFPLFQANGQFDPQRYETVLRNAFGTNAVLFEKELRRTLQIRRLQELATRGVPLPEEEVRQAYKRRNEKISVEFVLFDWRNQKGLPEWNEEELFDFYQKNKESFRRPEEVKAQYLVLKEEDVADQVSVTEPEIQSYYNANLTQFQEEGAETPKPLEEVRAEIEEKLLDQRISDLFYEKTSEITIALIRDDEKKVFDEFGLTMETTPFFNRETKLFPDEVTNQAFTQTLNEYSRPIQTPNGVYLVKTLEKKESFIPPFEECRNQVAEELNRVKSIEMARDAARLKRAELQNRMNEEGIPFSEAVKKEQLIIQKAPPFTRSAPFTLLPDTVIQRAFTEEINRLSEVIPTETGALLYSVVEKTTPEFKEDPQLRASLKSNKQAQTYQAWLAAQKRKANLVDLSPFF